MSSPPQKKAPSTATLAVPVVIFGLSIGAASALLGGACEHAPEHKPEAATLTTPSLKHGATPPQILAEDPAPPEEPRPEVAVALPEGMRPIEDESGVALDPFFAKLRRVEADEPVQARVLHYGDSHIAADLWTGRARGSCCQGSRGRVITRARRARGWTRSGGGRRSASARGRCCPTCTWGWGVIA